MRQLMKSKMKTFKKNQDVFILKNKGTHFELEEGKVFRFEELGQSEGRVFMYSNTSACYLVKDVFKYYEDALNELEKRNKKLGVKP